MVGPLVLLGCVHLCHLTPRPAGHAYPYPDFLQAVYEAEACAFDPAAQVPDEWVQESGFIPIEQALTLPLRPVERAYLDAALAERGRAVAPWEGRAHGR
jgi:hypothetical protein